MLLCRLSEPILCYRLPLYTPTCFKFNQQIFVAVSFPRLIPEKSQYCIFVTYCSSYYMLARTSNVEQHVNTIGVG